MWRQAGQVCLLNTELSISQLLLPQTRRSFAYRYNITRRIKNISSFVSRVILSLLGPQHNFYSSRILDTDWSNISTLPFCKSDFSWNFKNASKIFTFHCKRTDRITWSECRNTCPYSLMTNEAISFSASLRFWVLSGWYFTSHLLFYAKYRNSLILGVWSI